MRILFVWMLVPVVCWSQPSLVIRHITVIDVVTGVSRANQVVRISGDKIVAVRTDGGGGEVLIGKIEDSASVIDGSGKYLIPGLWDMHYHSAGIEMSRNAIIPLMLVNGITGMRLMWGDQDEVRLRDSIAKGWVVGPRMVVGSPLIDDPIGPWYGDLVQVDKKERVPVIIDSLQAQGYDFMKTYEFLNRDVYFAIARYCAKKHIDFAGHVPVSVTVEEASQAGMRSIEHLTGVTKAFSPNEDSLNGVMTAAAARMRSFHDFGIVFLDNENFTTPFDEQKAVEVAEKLRANRTAVVPTLSIYHALPYNGDELNTRPELAVVSKGMRDFWYQAVATGKSEPGYFEREKKNLLLLYRHGVLIMAGTDALNPYVVHGYSLHNELEWYVEAGMPVLAALQTATINPAIFLHREKSLGSVEKGKLADLVILNTDPLKDIRNTRDIFAVITNGKLIDRGGLDELLRSVKDY
jgi:imidazolonepropionase-like amidohydrolase